MDAYIFFSSLREYLRPKRIFPWILLAIGGFLLAAAWPSLNRNATSNESYIAVSEMLVFHVLALSSAIMTSAIVSQEVEQKTIVYLLTRPVSRWRLILFRYLASASVVAMLAIFGAICVGIGSFGLGFVGNRYFQHDLIALIVGALSYGALFLIISLVVNKAMMVCLLFAFGWETIVPNLPGEMYRLSIYSHIIGIADHPVKVDEMGGVSLATGGLSTNVITPGSGYVTMAVMVIVLIGLAAWWFTNFEYVPREDAE